MREPVRVVQKLIRGIDPADALEAEHRKAALSWLERTDDVFRRARPATPKQHLVSYVVLVDPDDGSTLLVEHLLAGLWLPPGGHVEPDEHPAATADREAREELGIEPVFANSSRPFFITVTRTVGEQGGHTDVSLWFLLTGRRDLTLTPDRREFSDERWWTPEQIEDDDAARFDPHYRRFLAKLKDRPSTG
jgi:8-oxo-dGTP pyrophosphatase MutT (NUDIX family)